MVGREHDPLHADLQQQVEKRCREIEARKGVVDIFLEISGKRASKLGLSFGRFLFSLGSMNGTPSPRCPITTWSLGYRSNTPPRIMRMR
jgi:hypothetical protein